MEATGGGRLGDPADRQSPPRTSDELGTLPDYDFANDFDRLYEDHYQALYRTIRGIVLDPNLAEDLTQDTFMKAYKARHRWRPDQAPRAWLHRIGVNTAISHARRTKVQRRLLERLRLYIRGAPVADPTDGADADLTEALRHLKPIHRAVIVLHYYHGYPYAEIADILGIPTGTVGSRISVALGQMRERLVSPPEMSQERRGVTPPASGSVTGVRQLNFDPGSRVAESEI
jgi:RNA polymerase sigma-70 factor (ECF subfamily)